MENQEITMIIVDDEQPVRELLKHSIDWKQLGIRLVGESSGAREAMKLIESNPPDLIFTDICMPTTDGIEFGRQVLEKYPHIKVLVLTGHDQFDYASRCIKAGIADFLLKPLDEDEIIRSVKKVREEIYRQRLQKAHYDQLSLYVEENKQYLQERALNSLLLNYFDGERIGNRLELVGLSLKNSSFRIAVIKPMSKLAVDDVEEQCRRFLKAYFETKEDIYLFCDGHGQNVVLCNDHRIALTEYLDDVKLEMMRQLQCGMLIGIGAHYSEIEQIRLSYLQACQALAGKEQILNPDTSFSFKRKEHVRDLAGYIKTGSIRRTLEWVDQSFSQDNVGKTGDIISTRIIATTILSILLNLLSESGLKKEMVFKDVAVAYDRMSKFETVAEIERSVKHLMVKTVQAINEVRNKTREEPTVVTDIKTYIINHYADADLSLAGVARHFHLNYSYLSRIFKHETGCAFTEYLAKIRMEKSIRLICATEACAYQIAEMVGISNPKYFSLCFKKYIGMTVNDFKKMMNN